jgi:Rho-binding antiterminator
MSEYTPIACELHDYIEIACMHRYRLLVELTDGNRFRARAITTHNTKDEEFLVLADSEAENEVRLDRLAAITPLDDDARFERVVLAAR